MPIELIGLLDGKDVLVGAIDVATDTVETPEEVAQTIRAALEYVPRRAALPLHQLRHGAAVARSRRRQAQGACRWGGIGPARIGLISLSAAKRGRGKGPIA